jgi:hypothetical protein
MRKSVSFVVKSSQSLELVVFEVGTCNQIHEIGGRPELLDVFGKGCQKIIKTVYFIFTYSKKFIYIVWDILRLNPEEDLKIF